MTNWFIPVPLQLIESNDSDSFKTINGDKTALPVFPHLGAFGAVRQHHMHEGVDFYCANGTEIRAVEEGVVVGVMPFTGVAAGCDWWHDTDAVLVEGATGVAVYGELTPAVANGQAVKRGDLIGHIKQVLKEDKGRPMSMLHFELHKHGTRDVYEWTDKTGKPESLLDPTPYFQKATHEK